MKWQRYLKATLMLAVLGTATIASPETCDAGNGCRITCRDGCSAVYNHDTGRCSTGCGKSARALADRSVELRVKHNITLTTKGMKGYAAQDKATFTPSQKPAAPPSKP